MNLQRSMSIQKLMIFRKFQAYAKDVKGPLEWCKKHESMFPIVGFFCPKKIKDYRFPN